MPGVWGNKEFLAFIESLHTSYLLSEQSQLLANVCFALCCYSHGFVTFQGISRFIRKTGSSLRELALSTAGFSSLQKLRQFRHHP
jgi:hypothetical protein